MHTPDEARTKWCPHARVNFEAFDSSEGINKTFVGNRAVKCCADECMAWRWVHELAGENEWRTKGYCGLAGAPRT